MGRVSPPGPRRVEAARADMQEANKVASSGQATRVTTAIAETEAVLCDKAYRPVTPGNTQQRSHPIRIPITAVSGR